MWDHKTMASDRKQRKAATQPKKQPPRGRGRAPSKNRGGGGTHYEQQVIAWLMACMLADFFPFRKGKRITELQAQASVGNPPIDDVRLTVVDDQDKEFYLRLFVRSQRLLSSNGLSADFVAPARQQLSVEQDSTRICCICCPSIPTQRDSLIALIGAASSKSEAEFDSELSNSLKLKREIAHSLGRTLDGDSSSISPFALLTKLEYIEFAPEWIVQEGTGRCGEALADSTLASALWESVFTYAAGFDKDGGTASLDRLKEEFRHQHNLRLAPEFSFDWRILADRSSTKALSVKRTIGQDLEIGRLGIAEQLHQAFEEHRYVTVEGPMGSGKSVISCQLLDRRTRQDEVLRFSLTDQFLDPADLLNQCRLRHSLLDILRSSSAPAPVIVFDQLDEVCFDSAKRDALNRWLGLLKDPALASWRVLLICSFELRGGISQSIAIPNSFVITTYGLSKEEIEKLPQQLQKIAADHSGMFQGPLFLDIATEVIGAEEDIPVEEYQLADRFWAKKVTGTEGCPEDATRLADLAIRTADSMVPCIPEASFMPTVSLFRNRIVEPRDDARIGFRADVFGRWARYRVLLSKGPEWHAFLTEDRKKSLQWLDAAELLFRRLIAEGNQAQLLALLIENAPVLPEPERGKEGELEDHFRKAIGDRAYRVGSMRSLEDKRSSPALHLKVLSAFALSPKLDQVLEASWTDFTSHDGWLLRVFLRHVMVACTLPNPAYTALEGNSSIGLTARTIQRIPRNDAFLRLLSVLRNHLDDVLVLAREEFIPVIECWLLRGPEDEDNTWAEEWILATAESKAKQVRYESSGQRKLSEAIYRCALSLYDKFPDRVRLIALTAMRRLEQPPVEDQVSETKSRKRTGRRRPRVPTSFPSAFDEDVPQEPWLDGPFSTPDEAFQKVWFENAEIAGLCSSNPELAAEITLAGLIEPPRSRPKRQLGYVELDFGGFSHPGAWGELTIWKNPLPFLYRHHPRVALDLCMKLLAFATERWSESSQATREHTKICLFIDGTWKHYIGDQYVLRWNWNADASYSPACLAALMVEKILCDLASQDLTVAEVLALSLLRSSDSAAVVGVVCDLVNKHSQLVRGPLGLLLSSDHLAHLEMPQLKATLQCFQTGTESDLTREFVKNWFSQPHKRAGIFDLIPHAVLCDIPEPEWLQATKQRIDEWLSNNPREEWKVRFRAMLDSHNYVREKFQGSRVGIAFREPDNVKRELELGREKLQAHLSETQLHFELFSWAQDESTETRDSDRLWSDRQIVEKHIRDEWPSPYRESACALASLLLSRFPDSTFANDDRLSWCIERIAEVATREVRRQPGSHWESGLYHWQVVVSRGLAVLLERLPSDSRVLNLTASLMWDATDMTAPIALRTFAGNAEIKSKSLTQLAVLAITSAVYDARLWLLLREEQDRVYSYSEPTKEAEERRLESTNALCSGIDLKVDLNIRNLISSIDSRDLRDIRSAVGWHIPPPVSFEKWSGVLDALLPLSVRDQRVKRWLALQWNQWISLYAEFISIDSEEDRKRSFRQPEQEGSFVEVVRFMSGESGACSIALVKPILELGASAANFVGSLAASIRIAALTSGKFELWKGALELAGAHMQWKRTDKNWADCEFVWGQLLGLGRWVFDSFPPSGVDSVYDARKRFEDASWLWARDSGSFSSLCVLLKSEAGRKIRFESLRWISEAIDRGAFDRPEHTDSDLAYLLEWIWRDNALALRDSGFLTPFTSILQWLSGRKVVLASELLNEVRRSSR